MRNFVWRRMLLGLVLGSHLLTFLAHALLLCGSLGKLCILNPFSDLLLQPNAQQPTIFINYYCNVIINILHFYFKSYIIFLLVLFDYFCFRSEGKMLGESIKKISCAMFQMWFKAFFLQLYGSGYSQRRLYYVPSLYTWRTFTLCFRFR